jgi:peptide/nickel transport system permease protein
MLQAPWLVLWPGLALALVVYGVNIFGDAVRDLVDPRLKGGVGRFDTTLKEHKTEEKEESLEAPNDKRR